MTHGDFRAAHGTHDGSPRGYNVQILDPRQTISIQEIGQMVITDKNLNVNITMYSHQGVILFILYQ